MNASFHGTQTLASSIFSGSLGWLQRAMAHGPAWLAQTASARASAVHTVRVLQAGDTIEVQHPLQHEVLCLKGHLWITHDRADADIVVERGQRYRAGLGSRMLVHAMDDARLVVSPLRG